MALLPRFKFPRYLILLTLFSLLCLGGCQQAGKKKTETSTRTEKPNDSIPLILSINDVYQLTGLYGGRVGGLPRVLTLRKQLSEAGHPVVLLHAGDFLHPSFVSRVFKGKAMIDVLNRLDSETNRFDPLMFVTFGNHEFDKGKLKDAKTLQQRMDESEFTWLGSNIHWQHAANGRPLIASDKLKNWAIVEVAEPGSAQPIRLGLFSITTPMTHPKYIERFDSPAATAKKYVPLLRQKGADFVVALTHQSLARDKKLLALPKKIRPDVVFGGHEHYHQLENVNGRWIAKADADAISAIVAPLERKADHVGTQPVLMALDEKIPPDEQLLTVAENWQKQLSIQYCERLGQPADCLSKPYGKTRVKLIGEESEIRRFETNLGDFIADTALQAFATCGANMAAINSGSIRLNQNIEADSPITSGHLEAMFAYPSPLKLIRIKGETLKQMLTHDIDKWTANGHWLLTAGFRFTHDPEKQQFSGLTHADGRPVQDDEEILLVVPDYLISPNSDHDGYDMIDASRVIHCPVNGTQLKDLLIKKLREHPEGIAPRTDGRVCNTLRSACSQ